MSQPLFIFFSKLPNKTNITKQTPLLFHKKEAQNTTQDHIAQIAQQLQVQY